MTHTKNYAKAMCSLLLHELELHQNHQVGDHRADNLESIFGLGFYLNR